MPQTPEGTPADPIAAPHDDADSTNGDRWTIGKLLAWTTDFLGKKGSESPRLDAEVLLAKSLDCQRVNLYTRFDEEVAERPRSKFRELVKSRAESKPVAYLVGSKEFYSLSFEVTEDVLIPRPDSEFVVLEYLEYVKGRESALAVDVGVGSGCLALACLSQSPGSRFYGTEISDKALAVASRNAERLKLAGRLDLRLGDLLDPVLGAGPFDAIVSNPPYVRSADLERLQPDVGRHEPRLALDGGASGLVVVERLIAAAAGLLKPGGALIIEIGSDQETEARDLISASGAFGDVTIRLDHARRPRVVRALRNGP